MDYPNYYAILPATVRYDGRLKPMEKLLYAELTALSKKDGYCWASNEYFAGLYGAVRETVSRWLSDLEKYGYIKVSIDKSVGNQRRIIVFEDQYLLTKKSLPIDEKIKTPYDKKIKQNNIKKNNKIKQDRGIDFERFWEAYPRKVAKADALKAFEKNVPEPLLATVLNALEKQKRSESWIKDGGKFIPYPATWLNGKRWEDESEPKSRWEYL